MTPARALVWTQLGALPQTSVVGLHSALTNLGSGPAVEV